jgi:hypothetical protein
LVFFLADFLAAFFLFLATVRPPLKRSWQARPSAVFDGSSTSELSTTQPTKISHARRRHSLKRYSAKHIRKIHRDDLPMFDAHDHHACISTHRKNNCNTNFKNFSFSQKIVKSDFSREEKVFRAENHEQNV